MTRLMTIADVFSALVDKRAYKDAMTCEEAINVMMVLRGHMDPDLLRLFREFVLDDVKVAA